MVKISPQQEIFVIVRNTSIALGYNTYDYLPPDGVSYPFVYIGEDSSTDIPNKSDVHGSYNLTIHIYNDQKKRGSTSNIIVSLKEALREITQTQGFYIDVRNMSDQITTDNTTNVPLSHGIIDVEFYFN